ncbi:MAG: SDR family NAD(P)-dependent oxidoreductase, partial [Pseudomonas sp.]
MALLNKQVALITGAGGGIGRGIALNFAKEGAAVVVAELDVTSGEAVVAELKALGAQAMFIKTDVCSKADIEAAVQLAVDQFGGLDILVNNAFAPTPNVLLEEKTDAMLEKTLGST